MNLPLHRQASTVPVPAIYLTGQPVPSAPTFLP